jgi:hypothetical protein
MLANIKRSKKISVTLRYNEQKIVRGKAECLIAENFIKDLDRLTNEDKLFHFRRITSLNDRAKTNSLHISLNFHSSEILSNRKMQDLAKEYMRSIGLSEQPYLAYRHYDAGHPHLHLVSTDLLPNGDKIDLTDIILHKSYQVTKEMEQRHSLKRTLAKSEGKPKLTPAIEAQKVIYGQTATQPAITNVLDVVISQYKFASLTELNAILRLYNVKAVLVKRNRGLLYSVLDAKGHRIGKPFNASSFYSKPTLPTLEKRFLQNQSLLQPHQVRLTTSIDYILLRQKLDLAALRAALQRQQITTVIQRNKEGQPQNIWYIDQQTKCIFDGNALGGRYNMAALQQRCLSEQAYQELKQQLRQEQEQRQTQRLRHGL